MYSRKVHITKQTKDQLVKNYIISESRAGLEDELLQRYHIETFLISPQVNYIV